MGCGTSKSAAGGDAPPPPKRSGPRRKRLTVIDDGQKHDLPPPTDGPSAGSDVGLVVHYAANDVVVDCKLNDQEQQFRRSRTKDHECSPGVVPTLKVIVWGADQKGQRRARCSDALPLVLARTGQEIALAAECLGSCPPAAPNPPSSYLPQTRHPVRVLIT